MKIPDKQLYFSFYNKYIFSFTHTYNDNYKVIMKNKAGKKIYVGMAEIRFFKEVTENKNSRQFNKLRYHFYNEAIKENNKEELFNLLINFLENKIKEMKR